MSGARFDPPPQVAVDADVARALAEDIGPGDATASLLDDAPDGAYLLCKEDCVVAGRPWFDACHRALDPDVRIDWRVSEGDRVGKGTVLATLQGRARALVSAERASLNFLQTLSGTATVTAQYVDAVRGTDAKILDTRKTLPGLRLAQKYAVRVGGGVNHRIGLYDTVMLKENHIRAAGSLTAAVQAARTMHPALPLIVEACNGCGLSGWGWEDTGYGGMGPLIRFATSGVQTLRIQGREDGISIDQIVLSPVEYLDASPGQTKNDATILAERTGLAGDAPPPPRPPRARGPRRAASRPWWPRGG